MQERQLVGFCFLITAYPYLTVLFHQNAIVQSPRRVVITGAGVLTALGRGWQSNASGFRQGKTAIHPVDQFDTSRQRVQVAGQIDDPMEPPSGLSPRPWSRWDRASKLLHIAATEAFVQAKWGDCNDSSHLPFILGTSGGGMSLGQSYYCQRLHTPSRKHGLATKTVHYQAQQQGINVARTLGFQGPVITIANACASGANAIGTAWEWIQRGQEPRMLAGGYDALSHLIFAGFDSLQALSPTLCRPFDRERDGLTIGEGAAVMALESLETAKERGAQILGELIGYATASDPHHLTQPHPQGLAAERTLTQACQSAGITPDQVDYINAHGTATVLNDTAELAAINSWAGDSAERIPVSSTKPCIGHLLGAAGAVEAVLILMVLQEQFLPPTPNTQSVDPDCRFHLVTEPGAGTIRIALTNSFGFGGSNATLAFRQWKET